MLDACNQVGWELHEAHQQVATNVFFPFIVRGFSNSEKFTIFVFKRKGTR